MSKRIASILVALTLLGLSSQARAGDDVHEFVALTEARPLLVRLHVRSGGKPVKAAWDEFIAHLFKQYDGDKDGTLNKDEAARVPTATQILSGGVAQLIGGGGNAIAPLDKLDPNKDGKVTPAEFADYYRMNGLAPFQFQTGVAANPLGAQAAIFSGGRTEPVPSKSAPPSSPGSTPTRTASFRRKELTAALRRDHETRRGR